RPHRAPTACGSAGRRTCGRSADRSAARATRRHHSAHRRGAGRFGTRGRVARGAAGTAGARGRDEASFGGPDRRRRAAPRRGPGARSRRARVDGLASRAHRRRCGAPGRGIPDYPDTAAANTPRAADHAARRARRPGGQRSPGRQRRSCGTRPSGAGSPTPTVTWERPGAVVTARGSYLRFESGRRSLQGLIAASVFTPPNLLPQRWRGELSFSTGGSSYAHFASFWHATAEARLHVVAAGRGAWIGGTGGRTSYGSVPRPVAVAGVGVWVRRSWVTVAASATRSIVGDTAYSDVASTMHASRGRFELDGSLAARVSSRGGGHGVYGEASTTFMLGERTALVVSGGRYPTDPVSGTVAGRYASAGLRLKTAMPRARTMRDPQPRSRSPANGDGGAGFTARLEVQPAPDGGVRVVVHTSAAATVELAGDFTDWQPVALR